MELKLTENHTNWDIEKHVWNGVRKTINKFREQPYYFFTESDIVTYFCQCLFTSRLEVFIKNRKVYLVHREYPTDFLYQKKKLLIEHYEPTAMEIYLKGNEKLSNVSRGHYDCVVLNPRFVESGDIIEIINKTINGRA